MVAAGACGRPFGIEGSGGYAFALAQFRVAAGEIVVEVPVTLTQRERAHQRSAGKSDPTGALAIARVHAARGGTAAAARRAGPARDLKLLYDFRRQLTTERTRTANRLHADLLALAPGDERMHARLARRRWRGCASSTARSSSSSVT